MVRLAARLSGENTMKIKTNIRAGAGGSANSGGTNAKHSGVDNTPSPPPPPPVYYPPVGRCVGY
jgi:hypothetical protein